MTTTLASSFEKHVQGLAGVAPNTLVSLRSKSIAEALRFVESRSDATKLTQKLRRLFEEKDWLLDSIKLQQFVQLVGELQFWSFAEANGVELVHLGEGDEKTPDFALKEHAHSLRFEVKTLSVQGGKFALDAMAEQSFETQLDLGRQLSEGKTVAVAWQEVAPHGPLARGSEQTLMYRQLIDKIQSNVKPGQFATAPTCLVVNLSLIDTHFTDPAELRPIVAGYPREWSLATGGLWTLAFGEMDQPVHCEPEFEGKPAIEGTLGRQGILRHPDNHDVLGLFFLVHPLREKPNLYALWRYKDEDMWRLSGSAAEARFRLCESLWNDDRDSNRHALPARS